VSDWPIYTTCPRGPAPFRDSHTGDPCAVFHFWSLHNGGANFAACDGSVRLFGYTANALLPALATLNGGELSTLPD
jgi:prepilin-type processing-associated H-X9-DG protein